MKTGAILAITAVGLAVVGISVSVSRREDDDEGGKVPTPSPPKPAPPDTPMPYEAVAVEIPGLNGTYWIADLTGLSNGVRWRVYQIPGLNIIGVDATSPAAVLAWVHAQDQEAINEIASGKGLEPSDPEARKAVEAFLNKMDGAPAGPDGAPAPNPSPGSVERHGIRLNAGCTELMATDPATWVAWAYPWLLARVPSQPEPRVLVRDLLSVAFANLAKCPIDVKTITVEGKPLGELIAQADAIAFKSMREGKLTASVAGEPTPIERAAATLVGATLHTQGPPSFPFRGYAVYMAPTDQGWRWEAYERGKDGQPPNLSGFNTQQAGALAQARQQIVAATS